MTSAISANSRLPHEDAFIHKACFYLKCFHNLENNWMATLDFNALPFNLWLLNNLNVIVKLVMVDGQFHYDWLSYWQ